MAYIRQHNLAGLRQYKYSAVDRSLVSKYVMKPFYSNVVIRFFPMSMAPNLITLTGFGFVILNFLTLLWYNPTLDRDCPSWVYASWALGLFLYQTFDAVDGTQARRTHQSGPLGELFDHGVDACNTAIGVLIFAGATNLGQGWLTVLALFGAVLTFYVQTWEEYFTGTFILGIVSGPVEGVLTLCAVYIITALMGGGSFWHQSMFNTLGLPSSVTPDSVYELSFNSWYLLYGAVMLCFNTFTSISHVVNVRWERKQDATTPLIGLLPTVATWVLAPTYLYLHPNILENHLIPFVLIIGLVNAYSVGQMITAHLVKAEFPHQNILLVPLALGVVDSLGPRLDMWPSVLGDGSCQVKAVFAFLGLALGVYGSFVHDVIVTICDYLDIWCLRIKYPYTEGYSEIVTDGKSSKKEN